jgi:nucleoid DNA-binding protein
LSRPSAGVVECGGVQRTSRGGDGTDDRKEAAMSEPKTKKTRKSVQKFLAGVEDARRREAAQKILALMEEVTGETPAMWGDSIVGFGSYRQRYESGREGEWPLTGFSPRKANLTLYIMSGFSRYEELLGQLGKHKTGKSCLYLSRLEDIDLKVLRQLIAESVAHVKRREHASGAA